MKWFTQINPDMFFEQAKTGLAIIGAVFAVLFAVLVVLIVRALKRNKRAEDDDAVK